jgi:hypothetical protein
MITLSAISTSIPAKSKSSDELEAAGVEAAGVEAAGVEAAGVEAAGVALEPPPPPPQPARAITPIIKIALIRSIFNIPGTRFF